MKKVISYKDRYIHEYEFGDKHINYCIGFYQNECFTDEEECGNFELAEYQDILKCFGAKQFEHVFEYEDGFTRTVQDSYFDTIEQCKLAINYLIYVDLVKFSHVR